MPTAPIRSGSASGRARRNDTAARRSASLPCGSSWRRGRPPDSPKLRWSNASVANPAAPSPSPSNPVPGSGPPVNGPVKPSPGARPPADGARRSPTSVMPSTPNSTRSIARLQTAQNAAGLPQPQPAAGLPASPAADEAPGRLGISGRLSGDYRITPAWGARRPNSGLPVPAGFGYPPSTLSLAGPVARLFAPLRAVAGCRGCQAEVMDVDVLFAGIPVSDFEAAKAWYERFFARPADVVANEAEVMWQVTDRGWLYIVSDADNAGNSVVAMAVPDIEEAASALAARGVPTGPIEREGEAGRKAVALDPDGNSIAIIEVTGGG